MNLLDQIMLIERLDGLIRRTQTGSPKQLAEKLGVSERTVYRILRDLRDMDLPIEYNDLKNSYIYTGDVDIQIVISGNGLKKSKGGKIFFGSLPNLAVRWIIFVLISIHAM